MLDSNIINTNKVIRSFFDKFLQAVGEITNEYRNKPGTLSTIGFFLDATIYSLEAEWAGLMRNEGGQWIILDTTIKWPLNFPNIVFHPILDYFFENREADTLGTDDLYKDQQYITYFQETQINNLAIVPVVHPLKSEDIILLIIANKRDRIIKGDESLPYYVSQILYFLGGLLNTFIFSNILEELGKRVETWKESLHSGSRKAIFERSRDTLKRDAEWLDYNTLDRVQASFIDTNIQLKILPHPRQTFKEKDGPEIKIHHDEGPFTKLSCLRRNIWRNFISPKPERDEVDEAPQERQTDSRPADPTETGRFEINKALETIEEVWKKLSRDSLSASVPPAPKLSDNVLSTKMTEKLWALAHRREYLIECLRTQLYLLHYRAAALEGVADNNEIAECDKIFYRDLYGCLRLSNYLLILVGEFLDVWAKESEEGNLLITSEWLIVWFAKKILQDRKWLHTLKEVYTPNGRAEFYYRFSAYFLYVLFLIRYFGEPNLFRFSDITEGYERFVDASLYLLAEYAHRVEQLPLNIPLYQILTGHIWANEAILYTIQDNYRDHHHHVWNVCLLGMVLLEAGLVTRLDPDWEKDANLARQRRRNWLLAGLLHDIGYGLNLNRHMLGHLNFLQGSPCLTQFLKGLNDYHDRSARELSVELDKWINFGKLQGTLDHGVVSALYLLFLDRAPQRPEEPVLPAQAWLKDIPEAFVATGKHNLDGVTISPKDDPLALLLLLCDHLQEWDRPHIDAMHLRRSMSASLHRPGQTVTLGKTVLRCLKANLSWQSDRVHLSCNQPVQIKLYYKDAGQERFQPAVIWCQNTYEFQRINFAEWPADLEIDLEVIHPVSQELSRGLRLWEMDLFEDFARKDQECLGLWAWFKAARAGTPGFSYQKVESPALPQETFKWVLKHGGFDLSRPPTTSEASRIIEAFPPGLYLRYTLWKEQRLREIRLRKR